MNDELEQILITNGLYAVQIHRISGEILALIARKQDEARIDELNNLITYLNYEEGYSVEPNEGLKPVNKEILDRLNQLQGDTND